MLCRWMPHSPEQEAKMRAVALDMAERKQAA